MCQIFDEILSITDLSVRNLLSFKIIDDMEWVFYDDLMKIFLIRLCFH